MTQQPRPRLLLIDGHSMAYRAFYALPVENFATSTGDPTNAVYGFTSMLINVLKNEEPTHVAIAFDAGRATFRTAQYAEYKGTRATTPEEFRHQVPLIKQVLDALSIAHLDKADYEADDIIATLACEASADEFDVLICSGDRDAFQLVTDDVTVLYPVKGVSELARMTPESVSAKYGVTPKQYPDMAALVGETSDNLPGVPGVGPKTAAKWLNAYGDLVQLTDHVNEIKGKVGDNLRAHLDQVLLNRKLNRLVTDLDLPIALADMARQPFDREAIHEVFDALQFRTLRDRLFTTFGDLEATPSEGFTLTGSELTAGGLAAWLSARAGVLIGVDVEGTVSQGHGDGWRLTLSLAEGPALTVDMTEIDPEDDKTLAIWLADEASAKAFHDVKRAIHIASSRGYEIKGAVFDTALAGYLCHPDQRSYELSDLVMRHLHRELRFDTDDSSGQAALPLLDEDEFSGGWVRAAAIAELVPALQTELRARGAQRLLTEVELPLSRLLAGMESAGIAADVPYLEELEAGFGAAATEATQQAFAQIGREVNLSSPKQLQEVLFDQLGMPKTKKIKTGYTTDAESLAELYAKTEHPFLQHLLAYRDATKLKQTVEGLLRSVADDGRIHTAFQQTIAATGRLSSTDPNLQNIPIRTAEGSRIRRSFVVGEGFETLLTADYSQIEMRIMAHLSQDNGLIEAFHTGEDLHRFVGSRVFEVSPEDVTAPMRAKVKAMSYGLAYGLSAYGLSRQLRIDTAEARRLMDEYFERFGGVRDYLAGVVTQARETGYTETILGRRRYLPDLTSDNRQRREMAERMALNAPIQGSAADIVKVAMIELDRRLTATQVRSRVLLQVHDELVIEVAPGEADSVEEMTKDVMTHAVTLSVPLDVSVGRGRSWREAGH